MSTRFSVAVVALAWIVGPAVAEGLEPFDIEGILSPRLLGPAPAAADPLSPRLVWVDPTGAAVGIDGAAREEAASLLRKMGISVSWRRASPGEPAQGGEVRVILLDRGGVGASGMPILGATPTRVEAAPFVWVHVPNVRAVMGIRPQGPLATVELPALRALGMALGRVVAHEVVHVLAPSVPHGTGGLMSEALTRRELFATRLPMDPEVGQAVRAALRKEPLPPAGAGVLAATTTGQELEQ